MAEEIKVSLNRHNVLLSVNAQTNLEVVVTGKYNSVSVTWESDDVSKVTVTGDPTNSTKAIVSRLTEGKTSVEAQITVVDKDNKTLFDGSLFCLIIGNDDYIVPLEGGKYGLIIHKIEGYDNSEIELIQGEDIKVTLGTGEGEAAYSDGWMLYEVSFHKEAYCPACMEIVIQANADLSMFNGLVSLAYYSSKTEGGKITYTQAYTIAASYYIFEKKKKGRYVTLKAYSVDRFLTKCRANRSFTRKTISQILNTVFVEDVEGNDKTSILSFLSKIDNAIYKCTYEENGQKQEREVKIPVVKYNLHHLENDNVECLIPHAVQYDESFYDFLVRLCNRNGEFLYCEDNQLHLGAALGNVYVINESTITLDIEYNDSDTTGNPVFNEIIYPSTYFEAIHCFDEHKYKLDQDSEYTYAKWSDFMPPAPTAISWAKSILEAKGILVGLEALAMKVVLQSSISSQVWHKINGNYRDKYFKKSDDAGSGYLNERFLFCDKDSPLQGDFYKNIFCYGEEARAKQVLVTCTTCLEPKLGDKIIIGGAEYVVYQVKGGVKAITAELSGYKEYYELLLLPFIATKTATKTATETATETVIKLYPLPMSEKWIRRASTQRAEVINNFDPKKLGRVQVKYKYNDWKGNTDTTPWINVTYPKASDGQGFMFMPDIGDVVLIDYEDGNVERPFMVGAFYDDGREPAASASMYQVGQTKSITSANGHHISFTDTPGGGAKFMAELIPIWSLVSKFGEGTKWGDSDKLNDSKYFSGGFEIGDELGIYSITGSTHEREISIKSPLGEVNINAFTGITINAPLGDVKIVGKNVEIEAKNNLTLTSGSRIPNNYYKVKDGYRELGTFIGGIIGMVGLDLTFYRTWFEAFFKPIGGTMLIKSHRYMQLEAGEGKTNIVRTRKNFKEQHKSITKAWGRSAFDDVTPEWEKYKTTIDNAVEEIRTAVIAYNEFIKGYNDFCINDYEDFKKGMAASINAGISSDYVKISECLEEDNSQIMQLTKHFENHLNEVTKIANSSQISDDCKNVVVKVRTQLISLLLKKKVLLSYKNRLRDTSWENLFNNLGGFMEELYNADSQSLNLNLGNKPKVEKNTIKGFLVKKLSNLELVSTSTPTVNLTDMITIDENMFNDTDFLKFKKSILPKVVDDLEVPNIQLGKWDISKKVMHDASQNAFGGEGLWDDNVWSVNEKGGIYMSAHRGRSYYMHEDGTLKLGMKVNKDNETLANYIRDLIWNVKID